MTASEESDWIPCPPQSWFGLGGNVNAIDLNHIPESFAKLADQYGEIYQLNLGSGRTVVCASQELCNELCDEKRFYKAIANTNHELKNVMGDGIFTSHTKDHSWKVAHRILMPIFGPLSIKAMFPQMMELASQLILRWDRFGSARTFDCVADYTRLTLDTIALIGFDYRFNSLYVDEPNQFVESMMFCQTESGRRANRPRLETKLRYWSERQYFDNIKVLHDICDEIVQDRRLDPREVPDLLNALLNNADPQTGEKLTDENIRYQMVTFLIAGHETTSGLLGFCTYLLMKNPEKLQKAREEVDRVLGNNPLEVSHLSSLKYTEAVMRESLRLYPTAPGWSVHCYEDTKLRGKYAVKPTDRILLSLMKVHRDPKVWGEAAEDFLPERMLNGGFEGLPPNSWKPFGNGARACIGRAFAQQEATIVLALLLQRFDLQFANPDYRLEIMSTLTIKPKNLRIRVKRRPGKSIWVGLSAPINGDAQTRVSNGSHVNGGHELAPLSVFYGSNQGTCKAFAETIRDEAGRHGFAADVYDMDSGVDGIPTDWPALFIMPSYEGQPPNNAKHFMVALEQANIPDTALENLRFAVLGVGNSDWASTYHVVPKKLDGLLQESGAQRLREIGLVNAAGDILSEFEEWKEDMWRILRKRFAHGDSDAQDTKLAVTVESNGHDDFVTENGLCRAQVLTSQELAPAEFGSAKQHLDIALPDDFEYESGDYLSVQPLNRMQSVRRVLRRFSIPEDSSIRLTGAIKSFMPIDRPMPVTKLLQYHVDIAHPISKRQLSMLMTKDDNCTTCGRMQELVENYDTRVFAKKATLIDILEDFPESDLSFSQYLDALRPLRPRTYSISSAPRAEKRGKNVCSITFDVLEMPGYFARYPHKGLASSYLRRVEPGDQILCSVQKTNLNFHLPANDAVSVIMIATGTGIAPMRGFIQERVRKVRKQGAVLGETVLYYGCRHPSVDYLYAQELEDAQALGALQLRPAFSRHPEASHGCRHVTDRLWQDRNQVMELIDAGAKVLLCGSAAKVSRSTNEALIRIYREHTKCDEVRAEEWLKELKTERYAIDVFG